MFKSVIAQWTVVQQLCMFTCTHDPVSKPAIIRFPIPPFIIKQTLSKRQNCAAKVATITQENLHSDREVSSPDETLSNFQWEWKESLKSVLALVKLRYDRDYKTISLINPRPNIYCILKHLAYAPGQRLSKLSRDKIFFLFGFLCLTFFFTFADG